MYTTTRTTTNASLSLHFKPWILKIFIAISFVAIANCAQLKILQKPSSAANVALNKLRYVRDRAPGNGSNKRLDICTEHLCACDQSKNSFVNVVCDFRRNPQLNNIFGSNYKMPNETISMTIKLAPETSFHLAHGFLDNNRVNRITIEGTGSETELVEITSGAFHGSGPYPDIKILGVFSVVVREKVFPGKEGKLTVRDSNDLILYANAFENAKINGYFAEIRDLRIEESAFKASEAKLIIESSHIDNIYRLDGFINEIRFVNSSIGTINGGAFDVVKINAIVFEGCRIDAIKTKAITDKLQSDKVSITDAVIGYIESEAIYNSGISELILKRSKIDTIQENAISMTAINATITRNNIKYLGNDWLNVRQGSSIIIERNSFGVFGRIRLDDTRNPLTCRFVGNSITKPLNGSLNFGNTHCIVREISVNLPCRCTLDWLQRLSEHDLRSEVYCTIDSKLSRCFNATIFNTLKYLMEVCDDTKTTLDCVKNKNLEKIDGKFFTAEELERESKKGSPLFVIAIGTIILISLVISIIGLSLCIVRYCRQQRHDRQASNAVPSASQHRHVFTEADRRTIEQALQQVQKKYPDIYTSFNKHIQKLQQKNLSDNKCSKIISQIEDLLNKVKSPRDDFTQFNVMLMQHNQPQQPSAPLAQDPIYTEPGLTSNSDGSYTSTTIAAYSTESYNAAHQHPPLEIVSGVHNHAPLPEHIYAEPNCAQQPLLRNEYASPADGNLETMDLYTEPINEHDRAHEMTTQQQQQRPPLHLPPYAAPVRISAPNKKLPPKPSKLMRPLPDVIFQSNKNNNNNNNNNSLNKPLTNVQKLAQDFQKMPKFHPNQRPRNLHLVSPPVYTAPDITHKQQQQQQQQLPQQQRSARLASPEVEECEMDLRGAAALPANDSGSSHSGGSNETVKIDDVIEYADA